VARGGGIAAAPARGGVAPRLWILLSAALFSTGGAAIKLSTLAPIQVACARSGIAALFLLCVARDARRRPSGPADLLVAAAFAATMLLFVLSSRMTTAANAVFLQATAPLYLLVLGPLVLGEVLRRGELGTLGAMALGLVLVCVSPEAAQATAPAPATGNLLAAAGGLSWALAIVGLRFLGRRGTGMLAAVMLGNAVTCVVALPFALPFPALETADLVTLLWLGCVQIGVAYLFATGGIRSVPAFEASLLFLVEPVLSPIWAWLVHGERPGGLALAGGAVILLAATRSAWNARGREEAHST
jgi:drug/metabolite transporter (DMT)-like permease